MKNQLNQLVRQFNRDRKFPSGWKSHVRFSGKTYRGYLHIFYKNRTDLGVRGSIDVLLIIRTDSKVCGSLHPSWKFILIRQSVDASISPLKVRTKSALRVFCILFFKIRTDSAIRGSLYFPPWKFGPNRRSVDFCIPFLKTWPIRSSVGPWIPNNY